MLGYKDLTSTITNIVFWRIDLMLIISLMEISNVTFIGFNLLSLKLYIVIHIFEYFSIALVKKITGLRG